MLDFFRRYQRYFLIFIAVVIVISFSFFGTQSTINAPQKIKDKCIGHAIDGSKIMESELDRMIYFIKSDRNDLTLIEKGTMPNFFNDGVIRKDLFGTGIGTLLINAYFDELKEELEIKMAQHKEYRPYSHPTAPFISAQNLWAQVLPAHKTNLDRFLHETSEMNPDTVSLLIDLYLGETAFPPNILREYLMFQQKHYNWIEGDPALPRANLNLFKCQSIEDWFGSRFVELVAQFILNTGVIAKEKGYKVTYEEAHVDLIRNGYEALKGQMKNGEVSQEDIGSFWQQQLRSLGMSEKEAVMTWQKIMLFRRLLQDVGGAVFVDSHMYQTFYNFASKTAEMDLYHLPEALEIKDFSELMKLEFYLDQVAKNRQDSLSLPRNFALVEEIEEKCPELVEKRFLVEVAEVKSDDIALGVSLKDMWEWQLEKENYELLEKEFSSLALKKGADAEGYFAAIESLNPQIRQKVDQFSRKKIIEEHPEWIIEALNQAHMNVREVSFSPNGENLALEEGLQIGETLAALLTQTALKGELEVNPDALKARNQLEKWTTDGETYYRFHVLDRDLNKSVLTFEEANERKILDHLLEKHLEVSYPKVRKKYPAIFKNKENEWKPFAEVKKEVGEKLYSEVLKNIEREVEQLGVTLSEDRRENLDGFYPKHRLFPFMYMAKKEIEKIGEKSQFLKQPIAEKTEKKLSKKDGIESQWSLIKETVGFKNHEKSPWFTSDVFEMSKNSWSKVDHGPNHRLLFFELKEKSVPSGNFSSEMKQGQTLLSEEAERCFMIDLIHRLQKEKVIQFHYDNPERA